MLSMILNFLLISHLTNPLCYEQYCSTSLCRTEIFSCWDFEQANDLGVYYRPPSGIMTVNGSLEITVNGLAEEVRLYVLTQQEWGVGGPSPSASITP